MIQFPQDFLWGAALSAYQAEGNNLNSDWWDWEKSQGVQEPSGEAARHYQLYKEDFDLAKQLNLNCHRLSIEWSRIQPYENKFSSLEMEHYKDVILSLRERSIEPIVTLHHFTNPLWFAKLGGWRSEKSIIYFLSYVKYVVEALSDKVSFWVTINEPMVYTYYSYIIGEWPPQEKSSLKAKMVAKNLATAHIQAYKLIHSIYKKKNLPAPLLSIAQNLIAFVACKNNLRNKFAVYLRNRLFNFGLIDKFIRHKSIDYLGINYYTRHLLDSPGWTVKALLTDVCKNNHDNLKKNSLGWEIYPQGLFNLLIHLKRYKLPIFVLENGISAQDDNLRWEFIREHLRNIYRARQVGADVRGYLYWSLIDNFEWNKGFSPRFGLIEVDYRTYKRTLRGSGEKFSLVCKTGKLD
jgi:beta-glucosidase